MFEYRVVPFRVTAKSQDLKGAQQVAEQLQKVIQENVDAGWDYVGVEQVMMEVAVGCLAVLGGARNNVLPMDQIVFRRQR